MSAHIFSDLPNVGAWRLLGAYDGFEMTHFTTTTKGVTLKGTSIGVEEGVPWHITYNIELDDSWHVQRATITGINDTRLTIQKQDARWLINGVHQPNLDGCVDLDLEASAVTNTIPMHRLALNVGQKGASRAAYVRTHTLAVEVLDQTYYRLDDEDGKLVFDYHSPRFDYRDTLYFAADGLVLDYPSIAARVQVKA